MTIFCAAPGCSAKKDNTNTKSSVLFHRFPLRKPDVLAKWVKAMKQSNFKPTVKTYLCGAHFTANDYEIRPGTGKHLKSTAVPTVFEKRRPGRKKKLLSESEEIKENEEDNLDKIETEVFEEEYLEGISSDKEETGLAEMIENEDKETLQILIVGEDGKITNSEYVFKKQLFNNEEILGASVDGETRESDTDDEIRNYLRKLENSVQEGDSSELGLDSLKNIHLKNKIKVLETNLLASRKKIKDLELKCKKMNKKLNRLKILLKFLVVKRGKGEKNLKDLLNECEKDIGCVKVKIKEEEPVEF